MQKEILAVFGELLDWCRTHTSPTQPNSPHEILVRAHNLLTEVKEDQECGVPILEKVVHDFINFAKEGGDTSWNGEECQGIFYLMMRASYFPRSTPQSSPAPQA